ncbi:MAG: right-handed parallel beta-helix repeat-containing protein [Desulfobacterales bacterium]|nr:MAG: right-handed parallel beta-helix repeat-containing protein [Desulfobacterales bacterium]
MIKNHNSKTTTKTIGFALLFGIFSIALVLGAGIPFVRADIWYVKTDGSDGNGGTSWDDAFQTIQRGIDAASASDHVAVADGTYTGEGNRDIDFEGKAITVRCTATAPAACTIDCGGMAGHRGFYFHSGEGGDSVLDGFTITNGQANEGGAIACVSASPTITNCKFVANQSKIYDGGAIYCSNASPTIAHCTFTSNASPYDGGGIYGTDASAPTITNCDFNANSAVFYGGAIFCEASSQATVTGCTFTGNTGRYGAGIACDASSPTISDCTFETNTAGYYGGAIFCTAASPQITGCTLTGNTATRRGGGIYCEASSAPTIATSAIITNTSPGSGGAHGQGGGIYSSTSSPILSACSLTGNSALSGAGVYSDDSLMTIQNCAIHSNQASLANGGNGGGLYIGWNSPTISGSTISGNSSYDGAGIYCDNSYPSVGTTKISTNTAVRYGGGIYANLSYPSLATCIIEGNDAEFGGGIRISGELVTGTTSVANCIIVDNTADYGAGIDILSSSPTFVNNTVTQNTAGIEGGGVRYYSTTRRPEFINTIFWGNTRIGPPETPDEIWVVSGATLFEYCNIQGGYPGTGNIDRDPLFRDAAANDFHLTAGSPCIDAATSENVPMVDYDGTARWDDPDTPNTGDGDDPYYDIGAYEYHPGCTGDFDTDGDVDGSDLAAYAFAPAGLDLDDFAAAFGRTNCL